MTDSDEDQEGHAQSPSQAKFDNSVIRMGRSLLAAAQAYPVARTGETPTVVLRLTRLDPSPADDKDYDSRIPQTIDELRKMGIDVQLGEHDSSSCASVSQPTLPDPRAPVLRPSSRINLDLSVLIALVSDLTHSPLPVSIEEAEARFTPGAQYVNWKKKRMQAVQSEGGAQLATSASAVNDDGDSIARPARALVQQVRQEMRSGLLQELFEKTRHIPHVEFWTTPEARHRCAQIISKIGGPVEKARAVLLFTSQIDHEKARTEFWQHSRYPANIIPLLPIKLLPAGFPDERVHVDSNTLPLPFFRDLERTCRAILADGTMPDPRSLDARLVDALDDGEHLKEIPRATVMKANPRLTEHTVQSMLWGAVKGWTTLTANRSSVKLMIREMKVVQNGPSPRPDGVENSNAPLGSSDMQSEEAALWTLDPRSLAEGMRADVDLSQE